LRSSGCWDCSQHYLVHQWLKWKAAAALSLIPCHKAGFLHVHQTTDSYVFHNTNTCQLSTRSAVSTGGAAATAVLLPLLL
jgi:hypothetical protein